MLAYAAALDTRVTPFVLVTGSLGAVLLAFVLLRGTVELLAWALLMAALSYVVALLFHGTRVDGGAPLVAAGLFLSAELAAWSLDEQHAIAAERAVWMRRATGLAALAAAGIAVSGLVVALSLAPGGGLAWTVLGAAASVTVVGLAVQLARRPVE